MAQRTLRAVLCLLLLLAWCAPPCSFAQSPAKSTQPGGSSGPRVHWPDETLRTGNTGMIQALALSVDGHWLASSGSDNTVVLWNAVSGEQEARFSGQGAAIIHLTFSPDAGQLASTSFNGNVRVWDLRNRRLLYSLNLGGSVKCLQYTADGKFWVASVDAKEGSGTARIELHEATAGVLVQTISADWVGITAMTVTGDGLIIAAGLLSDEDSAPGSVHVWNLTTRQMQKSYPVSADAFSPDGHWMGWIDTTRSPKRVVISDLATGSRKQEIPLQNDQAIYFSADSKQFAMTDPMSLTLKLWSIATGELRTMAVEQAPGTLGLTALAFTADGKSIAAAPYPDYSIRLWDVASRQTQEIFYGQATVQGMVVTRDGSQLIAGSPHGLDVWDTAAGRRSSVVPIGHVSNFAFSPDGRWLATNPGTHFAGEKLVIWDTKLRKVAAEFSCGKGGTPVSSVAFVINASPLKELGPLSRSFDFTAEDGKHAVWSSPSPVASSPDGRLMAIQMGSGGNVAAWDMTSGQRVATLAAHNISVSSLAFSRDGSSLLTVGPETQSAAVYPSRASRSDWGVKIWDTTTWKPRLSLVLSREGAPCAAFSPDGHQIVVERAWDRVEILDAATGASLEVLRAKNLNPNNHQFAPHNVIFSADGARLFQGSQNGIRVWKVAQP